MDPTRRTLTQLVAAHGHAMRPTDDISTLARYLPRLHRACRHHPIPSPVAQAINEALDKHPIDWVTVAQLTAKAIKSVRSPNPPPLTAAASLALAITLAPGGLARVNGTSMHPTLRNGSIVLTVPFNEPRYGEIVTIRLPGHPALTKRIVGLPGDRIHADDGLLYRNGQVVDEDGNVLTPDISQVIVPADHVYVLGDNRTASNDSRSFGPIPIRFIDEIVGPTLWPQDPFP